ncbi:MAG: YifB family Mg chelatase-like AAA ATPase [Clostridiales bacterium]|jgi:magnesium chelatase family protein|nr:YifB family Mg chelatase-like AAA ATPase [Clostridiales bacterium]
MLAKIISGAISGVNGYIVEVEVDISQGMPAFEIVGLPDSAVKESRERVRTAIKNCGHEFPVKRICVNLAPADVRKEGPAFDLPIAVGILACMGALPYGAVKDKFFSGELSLDGAARPVNGMLPMVCGARDAGRKVCVVPYENAGEASLVAGVTVIGVRNIAELVGHFLGSPIAPAKFEAPRETADEHASPLRQDFVDVRGQENVKRALLVAAAGSHNVLMIGPPGSGKTMMAKCMPGILPDLTFEESMEVTKIYSVAGLLRNKNSLITVRPFRAPHHTASYTALTGGGRIPRPGEISLAHNGVLFLDELPEFQRQSLEVMRQPLEERQVTISRVNGTAVYPAGFMLMASMNPCPCGHYGSSDKCGCTQNEISKYLNKISGPLLDRIDLQVEAAAVKYGDFVKNPRAETSARMKARVVEAHALQSRRYANDGIRYNSQLTSGLIERYCVLGNEQRGILRQAFDRLGLSARAYHKILKVARTVADLDGEEHITPKNLMEAVSYRSLDRKYWG